MIDETRPIRGEKNADFEANVAVWLDRLLAGESIDPVDVLLAHPGTGHEILEQLEAFTRFGRDDTPTPRRLGGFTLLKELGRGGMGVVYEAYQQAMDRRVALKILPPGVAADRTAFIRFLREAQTAGKLKDPAIVGVHALGIEDDTPYYAMELVEGPTLAEVIARRRNGETCDVAGSLGRRERDLETHAALAKSFAELAAGLHHAHREGVVHRDIKPSNIIVDHDGRLRILDFGLAYLEDLGTLTLTGETVGTPLYMSPEQARRERISVDHRTDIYSLGATLYETLALEPPFRGKDREDTLRRIVESNPPSLRFHAASVPEALETVVLKCLRKCPDDRYASAEALAQDLRRFARAEPIEARPEAPWARLRRRIRRQRLPLTVAFVVGVLLALSGTLYLRSERIANEEARAKYGPAVDRLAATLTAGQFSLGRSRASYSDSVKLPAGFFAPLSEADLRELVRDGALLEIAEAIQGLESLTRRLPGEPDGHYQLARGYLLLDDTARAQKEAHATLHIDPQFYPARWLLAGLAQTEPAPPLEYHWSTDWARAQKALGDLSDWKTAAKACGSLIRTARTREGGLPRGFLLEAHLGRGVALLAAASRVEEATGEETTDEAIQDFAVARHLAPSSLEPVLLLGKTYLLKDRKRKAQDLFDELYTKASHERQDEIALWVAMVHVAVGDFDGALAWGRRLANDFFRGRLLGYLNFRRDDLAAAVRSGRVALEARPRDLPTLLLHGTACIRLLAIRGNRPRFDDSHETRDALVVELAQTAATALGLETENSNSRYLLRAAWAIANRTTDNTGNEAMNTARSILLAAAIPAAITLIPAEASGQYFLDDFEDGSLTDGNPVVWSIANGRLQIEGGELFVFNEGFVGAFAVVNERVSSEHSSVRALVSFRDVDPDPIEADLFVGLHGGPNTTGYTGRIASDGNLAIGRAPGGGFCCDKLIDVDLGPDFDPSRDWWLELEYQNARLTLSIWEECQVRPAEPQLVAVDNKSPYPTGVPFLGFRRLPENGTSKGVFHQFEASTGSLPRIPDCGQPTRFRRGEVNGDGNVDLSDAVSIFGFLFLGNPSQLDCEDAADTDDSGELDLSDGIYLLNWLFGGGPAPPAPGIENCGEDPTSDSLGCAAFEACN